MLRARWTAYLRGGSPDLRGGAPDLAGGSPDLGGGTPDFGGGPPDLKGGVALYAQWEGIMKYEVEDERVTGVVRT